MRSNPELFSFTGDGIYLAFTKFYQRSGKLFASCLIRSFATLQSDRIFVSSLTSLFETSTKVFQFFSVTTYPYQFGSAPIHLQETFLASDLYRTTFESDPVWFEYRQRPPMGSDQSGFM